jgi:hypothetical protein
MPQTASRKQATKPNQPPGLARQPDEPTEDHVYGLVSVLYHALQGVQATEQYMDDAERSGDADLVRFFERCRDQQSDVASQAKQLLAERVDESAADEDDEDEDDEDED